MTPRPDDVGRQRAEMVEVHLDSLLARLDRLECRSTRVRAAMAGVTRELGSVSLGGPCDHCRESLLLFGRGYVRCPRCGYQQSV